MVKKIVRDRSNGMCFKRLKTKTVSIVSFGIMPLAANLKIYTARWAKTTPDKISIVEIAVVNSSFVRVDLNNIV